MAKSDIEKWLDGEERDYQKGVELYAAHPTAQRGLLSTFQRKMTSFTIEKLAYALQKAAEADAAGDTEALKKKGKASSKKKATKPKAKTVKEEEKQPTPPPMGEGKE